MALTFAEATAVAPDGDGRYQASLRPEYAIGGTKPNGGYLLAALGVGPATIEARVLRAGRTATQVSAAISGGGKLGAEARFTLATLPADGEPYWGGSKPVALPPLEECDTPRG